MAKTRGKSKAKPKAKSKAKAKSKPANRAAKPSKVSSTHAAKPSKPGRPAGPTLRALRSMIYKVHDLALAKAFYGMLLDRAPYFDQPFYVGFDVDGHELGLDPDVSQRGPGPGGGVGYWRVDDLQRSWAYALANAAGAISPPRDVGGGIQVAIVSDPFGNHVGLIETP